MQQNILKSNREINNLYVVFLFLKSRGGKLLTINEIKSVSLKVGKTYVVRVVNRGKLECKLIQQTEILFIFKPLEITEKMDKSSICIYKSDWLMDKTVIREVD